MKVLGIDTSGYTNAIGVADGDRVLADFTFEARTDSLEKIVSNIDSALQGANLNLEDVQGIGVGLGPGSWTGIRVGVTAGKILAYSLNKPVCGVATLEALACSAGNESRLICPIISAGTGDAVYAAFYRAKDGVVARTSEFYVGDLPGLSEMIREPAVVIGFKAESYSVLLARLTGISIKAVETVPNGSVIAQLAARRFHQGESDNVLSLTPLYLKESTARAFLGRYASNARKQD